MENSQKTERRSFFSKIAKLGIASGIGALLLGHFDKTLVPPAHAADLVIDANNTGSGTTSLTSSVANNAPTLQVTNTATTDFSKGIWGQSNCYKGVGVYGYAGSITGNTNGVIGTAESNTGTGVFGWAKKTTGTNYGVSGESNSTMGTGVCGLATATSGSTEGVCGECNSPDGIGVAGYANAETGHGIGVAGWSKAENGIGVLALGYSGNTALVAQSWGIHIGNLQEWRKVDDTPLSAVNYAGWLGIGTSSPARSIHLRGNNACFRMDRDANSSAFIIVRTASGDFNTVWKSFYVGVDASGVNNGEFFIGDVGTNVSGGSTKRLRIYNNGDVWVKKLLTGDLTFANGVVATEEGDGLAFVNRKGKKIAVLDEEGNFHIKGKVMEDL